MRVHYKENGKTQIREVPVGANPDTYKWGILVGPPDLSELSLSTKKIKDLTEALALAWMGDYRDTQGRRHEMMEIIMRTTGKRDKEVLRHILYIYQKNYFEDSGS